MDNPNPDTQLSNHNHLPSDRTSIKDWSSGDRPREKLLANGKSALSDAELLAIIIGSGNRQETAVALMQRILKDVDNNLNQLGGMTIQELMRYKGIGQAKAISIVALMELGRRRQATATPEKPVITSSNMAYDLIAYDLMDLHHEEFWILMLNNASRLIRKERISNGSLGAVLVDPKMVFKQAIDHRATAIILVHNHPSGNRRPSAMDHRLTAKMVEAGKILDIKVHDHLIIAGDHYYSFADEGEL